VWVGPKELLWMANNYRVAKKLDGRQVIVVKALEDCVEKVIKEARSYHVGNSSRFSLTLTNQTVVNLATERLNMLAGQPAERWPGHGRNCRCEEPIQACADPDLSVASTNEQQVPSAAMKIAKAMSDWADAVEDQVQQNRAIEVSLKTHVHLAPLFITQATSPLEVKASALWKTRTTTTSEKAR